MNVRIPNTPLRPSSTANCADKVIWAPYEAFYIHAMLFNTRSAVIHGDRPANGLYCKFGSAMRRLRVTMDGQIAVLAVAEKGSFEAAGKYLGVGKSAVRKRVRSVDSELGTPVFRSIGKGMVPTEAGNMYLPVARESVRQASLGVDRVRAFLRVQTNDLRIGYSSQLNLKLLAVITQLRLRPNDSLQIRTESLLTRQVIMRVLQGELNVGFGFLPIQEPDLFARQLMEEPLMVCLPAGHRLGVKREIQPEELENEPMIAVGRKALPGKHEEMVAHFESLGVSLRFVADAYLPREALWQVSQGRRNTQMDPTGRCLVEAYGRKQHECS